MNDKNISNKIIYWYDNNKRFLPWRKKLSKQNKEYYTLVSEFMLQQTQVKTVIPYFVKFINKIPNITSLAKVNNETLMRHWEGLGYYSRARNLKKTAIKIIKDYNGRLPSSAEELKELPGIGEYTSKAIMAIAFNKKIIPLDGNVERILKRVFYLRKDEEISKEYLNSKINFFGISNRASDYAQAIMEIGALVCKPNNPLCEKCPISQNCISYKKNDFVLKKKNKLNKTKYFEAKIYQNNNTYLLVKNRKFNFLKNMPIFPMSEVKEKNINIQIVKKLILNYQIWI
tara:strand:- start:319 stop:1176 length:858 start_codon:yes stop_codon:yes gene_type:complete